MKNIRLNFCSEGDDTWENVLSLASASGTRAILSVLHSVSGQNRKHAQEEMWELEGWGDVVGLLLLVFLKSTIWSFWSLSIWVTFFHSCCIQQDNSSNRKKPQVQSQAKSYLLLEDNFSCSTFKKLLQFCITNIQNMQKQVGWAHVWFCDHVNEWLWKYFKVAAFNF